MADLTRNDIVVRGYKSVCCASSKANTIAGKLFNGMPVSKCEVRQLKLLTAYIEMLRCYQPPLAETLAEGSFTLTGTTGGVRVFINAVDVTNGAVAFDADLTTTAANVAAAITAFDSTPNYTATSAVAVVTVTAVAGSGAGANSFPIESVTTGDMVLTSVVDMAGGVTGVTDDDNCFTVAQASNVFNHIAELCCMKFAPNDTTYVDPLVVTDLPELETADGDTIDATGGGMAANEALNVLIALVPIR